MRSAPHPSPAARWTTRCRGWGWLRDPIPSPRMDQGTRLTPRPARWQCTFGKRTRQSSVLALEPSLELFVRARVDHNRCSFVKPGHFQVSRCQRRPEGTSRVLARRLIPELQEGRQVVHTSSSQVSRLQPGDWPPRWLAMLHGPNDPAWGHCPHPVPPALCRDSTSTRPLDEIGLALATGTTRDSMGSEWGLGPLRIGSTTADVSAIHWFAGSRLRRRGQSRHPAVGSG